MTKKWSLMLVFVLALTLVLSACGDKKESNNSNNSNNSNSNQESGLIKASDLSKNPDQAKNRKDTFIIGMTDPKGIFNPLFMETAYDFYVVYSTFDTLITYKADGSYENSLADKVEVSEDNLTYTYTLKDAKFVDGTPVTSKDYLFTWKAILDPSYDGDIDGLSANIVGAKEYREGTASEISGIKIIDDRKFSVTVSEYTALTPVDLGFVFIMPEGYYGKDYKQGSLESIKALNSEPVGSGQFKVTSYKAGQEIVLEANEDYFRGAPSIKNLIFKTTTDSTNLAMLQSGETDMNNIVVSEDNVEALKAMGFMDINILPNNGYGYVAFNHDHEILSDVKVRQALTYGLNRAEIVEGIYGPYADVINIPQSKVSWAYTEEDINTFDFDTEKAKSLLDEAGWKVGADGIREKDGKKLKLNFSATANNPVVDALLPIMTLNYKELGIDLTAETLEFNAIMDKKTKGDYDMFFAAWGLTPDPDNTIFISDGAQNDFGYSNPEVDKLMAEGKKELDVEKRKAIYKKMYQLINEDAVFIYMYQRTNMEAYNARAQGFDISPYKDFPFSLYQVQLEQ